MEVAPVHGRKRTIFSFCPIVSPDGKYFFFTSERGIADQPLQARLTYAQFVKQIHGLRNGLGDIYRVDSSVLNLNREAGR
jgi:hypothetical protein